jgi:zinc protease
MGRVILSIATAMAVAIAPAPGGAQPAPPAPPAPKPASKLPTVEQATLANGLRIAVLRNDTAPVVAVQIWYRAGSKDEPRNRRGMAQLFKHMMFQGTKHVRTDTHAQFVNSVGGYTHALTDEDATHFINTLPADYLDFAIRLEADRMRNLLLRPEVIAKVRDAAKDEIRQQEGAPLAKGFLRFLQVAYTKHPYAWTAEGSVKDVEAVTADDLKKFYDAYYQPNNALLVVVGKATLDAVKASAEKHFGSIPKAADPPRPSLSAAEPPPAAKRRQVVEPGPIGLTFVGFPIPAAKDKDIYALQVASIVLGAGES